MFAKKILLSLLRHVLQKRNTDFGQASISSMNESSINGSLEELIDNALLDVIDTTRPEAGKSLLTNLNNKEVVLGELKGQTCNTTNQIINK